MNDPRQRYLDFGEFRLDTQERVLSRGGIAVPLTVRCYDLLVTFANNGGHLLTHEELMASVWNDATVDRSSIKQTIATLRKILGDVHEEPQYIQTVPRFGYRFVADVASQADENLVLVAERESLTVLDYEQQISTNVSGAEQTSSFGKRALVLSLGALLLLILGFTYWDLRVRSATKPDFLSYTWRSLSPNDKEAVVAISPNGEFIIFYERAERSDCLKMRRLAGEESITILSNLNAPMWGGAISHDNNYFYYILAERASMQNAGTLYRVSVLGGQPRKILDGISGGPTLSPDDRRVAFIRNGGPDVSELVSADATDGSDEYVISRSDAQPALFNPAWSPDGNRIVCFIREKRDDGTYYSLVEISPDGGELRKLTEPSKQYIWWHSWLHDGSGLLAVKSDDDTNLRQLVFISYPAGEITKISNDLNQYSAMSVSDAGDKIVTNRYERDTKIVITDENATDGQTLNLLACCPDTLSWLSDDQIVFDAFADGKRSLWTTSADGANQQKLFLSDTQDWSPNAAPDGRSVVFLSTRSGSRQIWKCNADGSKPQQVAQLAQDVDTPRFSPDGSYIYFSLLKDSKWTVARINVAGEGPEIILDQNVALWDLSPDGKSIIYTYWPTDQSQQSVGISDVASKELKLLYKTSTRYLLRWTPDGKGLLYEQNDPDDTSQQMLLRQAVLLSSDPLLLKRSPFVNYFVAVSPDQAKYAYVRGRLISSPMMLVRK